MPPAEFGTGGAGGTNNGTGGGWPGGAAGLGGGGAVTSGGTGGIERATSTVVRGWDAASFLLNNGGRGFNLSELSANWSVEVEAPGEATVREELAGGEEAMLAGVLQGPAVWAEVALEASTHFPTWQTIDTSDQELDAVLVVARSAMAGPATAGGVSLDAAKAQIVLIVRGAGGVGRVAEVSGGDPEAVVYSNGSGFSSEGPSDPFGFVVLLNVPVAEGDVAEVALTVLSGSDPEVTSTPVVARAAAGAVTYLVVPVA